VAIDDPMEAFEQQYIKEEMELPTKLARLTVDTGSAIVYKDLALRTR
jgi:hypothetical protein